MINRKRIMAVLFVVLSVTLILTFYPKANFQFASKIHSLSNSSSSNQKNFELKSKTNNTFSSSDKKNIYAPKSTNDFNRNFLIEYSHIFDNQADPNQVLQATIEFISNNQAHVASMFEVIEMGFLSAVEIRDNEKVNELHDLLKLHYPIRYKDNCYVFYLTISREAKFDDLEKTIHLCRNRKGIQDVVSSYISLIYNELDPVPSIVKYNKFKETIPILSSPSSIFSKRDIEQFKIETE